MKRIATIATVVAFVLLPLPSNAGKGDAIIHYNLGLAAQSSGNLEEAYKRFKKACMASDGFADACMAWSRLAREQENAKDEKRALSSAVMLDPSNVPARYALGVMLLKNKDYTWAIEHLTEAVKHSKDMKNNALLHYYLGYALYKNRDLENAARNLSKAFPNLRPELQQRCNYYRGLVAELRGQKEKWATLMLVASKGPDETWSTAATNRLLQSSAFPRKDGFSGQVIASIGVNTHPASAFLDDIETDSPPALQSVFRADGIYTTGGYKSGIRLSLTAYREQNWTELGEGETAEPAPSTEPEVPGFEPGDFNTTLFLPQFAYVHRMWKGNLEHEVQIGLDGETQFLDNLPQKDGNGDYEGSGFGMNAWAVAAKVWWSLAASSNTTYEARLKFELRPNFIDENRSTTRYRLRLLGTRNLAGRALRLRAMVGGRYDRAYANPAVYKYDRLVPELDLDLRWRTPLPRLSVLFGGGLKYNWYMNSKGNQENSFRPAWVDVEGVSAEVNDAYEEGYYSETRHDFEWELNGELNMALWKRALVAVTYKHHQRLTNLDEAPTPIVDTPWGPARVEAQTFGYTQDIVMLELRQGF